MTWRIIVNIHDDDMNTSSVDVTLSNDIYVTVTDIESVVGQLSDKNKSCGLDGIYAEHLKHSA